MPKQNNTASNKRRFKVGTWNMQGSTNWTQVKRLVTNTDLLALQETGSHPFKVPIDQASKKIKKFSHNFGTRSRPMLRHVAFWENTINKHNRNSLVVISKSPIRKARLIEGPSKSLRPALLTETDDVNFGSFHAPSKHDNVSFGVTRNVLSKMPGNTLIGGDFNMPPSYVQQKGGISGFSTMSQSRPTQQSGRNLDFFMTNKPVQSVRLQTEKVMSDHFAVTGTTEFK